MIEQIIKNVLNEMTSRLDPEQMEHLSNVLYLNFHGKEIQEEHTELVDTGEDGDEAKIRMFVASKIAMNRKRKTLQHYVKEVRNVLAFLGKSIDAVTGMDLRMYYGYEGKAWNQSSDNANEIALFIQLLGFSHHRGACQKQSCEKSGDVKA